MNNQQRPAPKGDMPVIPLGPRRGGGPMAGRMNAEKPKNTKRTLVRLLKYIGRNGVILGFLILIMLAVTVCMQFVITAAHKLRPDVEETVTTEE